MSGIESILMAAQFRWTGHVIRMDHSRIPKQVFYGQLANGKRACDRQYKCYKDTLKANLNNFGIPPDDLEYLASDRITWRAKCMLAVEGFELNRIAEIKGETTTAQVENSTLLW